MLGPLAPGGLGPLGQAQAQGLWTPRNNFSVLHWWSADGTLWQTSARASIASSDGDFVGAIDDQITSGGINALQSNSALRPQLRIVNGTKAIKYNGTTDILTTAFTAFPSKRGCIFVSMVNEGATLQTTIVATFNGAGNNFLAYTTLTGATKFKFYDGAQHNSAAFDVRNTAYVQSFHRTGDTAMGFYRNGTLADNLTIQNLQQASLAFYMGGISLGADFIGLVKDVIVTSDISTSQRQQIENYLLLRAAPTATLYIAYGDSITFSVGASDYQHCWVSLVETTKNTVFMLNRGISNTVLQNTTQNSTAVIGGAATNNGQDTLASRVTAYAPTKVLMLYGLNDLRLNDVAFTVTTYQNSLSAVVDAMVASGISAGNIVLGSPPYNTTASFSTGAPFNGGSRAKQQSYRDAVAAVATAKGTAYIDVYQWMVDHGGDTLMGADGIHPNDTGHQAIANAFLSVL